MIINFFNREFMPLTDNNSLNVDNYELIKRAVDFDTFRVVSVSHKIEINPFFVTMENEKGNYVYGAMAGLPKVDTENKTNIITADLKTLLRGEVAVDFRGSDFTGATVLLSKYITTLWGYFLSQLVQGYYNVHLDLTGLTDREISTQIIKINEIFITDLWDLFSEVLLYNDCFIDSRIDLINKRIIYRIADNKKFRKSIQLSDYGLKDFNKFVAPVNETIAYSNTYTNPRKWILTSQNEVTQDIGKRDIFPIQRRLFVSKDATAAALNAAESQAILTLAENKYQENITIPFNQSIEPSEFYFDTFLDIYPKAEYNRQGERINRYKSLPVGAIGIREQKENEYWLEIGYRPNQAELLLRKLLGAK